MSREYGSYRVVHQKLCTEMVSSARSFMAACSSFESEGLGGFRQSPCQ